MYTLTSRRNDEQYTTLTAIYNENNLNRMIGIENGKPLTTKVGFVHFITDIAWNSQTKFFESRGA